MARQFGALTFGPILTGDAGPKTIALIVAPSDQLVITTPEISFRGTDPVGAKILVEFIKGAGGGTGTTKAVANKGPSAIAIAGVLAAVGFKVEPTTPAGGVIAAGSVHPQHGYTYPGEIVIEPGVAFSIRVTSTNSLNCDGTINFEK